jgi:hypothetical protein
MKLARIDNVLLCFLISLCDDCIIEKRNVCKTHIHEVFDLTFTKIPIPDSHAVPITLPIAIIDNMKKCKLSTKDILRSLKIPTFRCNQDVCHAK